MHLPKRPTSARPVVGLDIEPGAVHAAQVGIDGGRLCVERGASAALDPGVVRDGEVVDAEALAQTLREMFSEHRLGKRVRIGVANQRVVVRHMMLPPISDPKELATAIRFQAESELPMPVDQAVLEHVSLGLVDTPLGPRQRLLLVAARRDMIDRLLGSARAAGLQPEGIDLSAFGMVRALAAPPGALVLHVSVGGLVNLAATRGGECVFTRVIVGGLEPMAIDLAERRGLSVAEARVALVQAGVPAGRDASEPAPDDQGDATTSAARDILSDGVRRISAEIRNSIDFHLAAELPETGGRNEPATVERVLLTGSGVGVPGLAEALSAQLGQPVEIADVAGGDPAAPGSHAVAAGLAVEEMAA